MLNFLLGNLKYEIKNHKKSKERRLKRWIAKQKEKLMKVKTFGKTRYYLSVWFGEWVLYFCNNTFYNQPQIKKVAHGNEQPSKVISLNEYRIKAVR